MKRGILALLITMLVVDLYLAMILFKPELTSSIVTNLTGSKVQVYSLISDKNISVSDQSLLNKKLEEIGFWNEGAIKDDENVRGIQRTTAKFLKIGFTEEPQEYIVRGDKGPDNLPFYSYSRRYDSHTQTITITIQVTPLINSNIPLQQIYSGAALASLINLTSHDLADSKSSFKDAQLLFHNIFLKNPEKSNFIKIN